jgi:hypothetical protein
MSAVYAERNGNWKFQMTACFGEWLAFDSVTYYSSNLRHYRAQQMKG